MKLTLKTLLKPLLAASLLSLTMGSVAMASPNNHYHRAQHAVQKHQTHAHVKKARVTHHRANAHAHHRPTTSRGLSLFTIILGR